MLLSHSTCQLLSYEPIVSQFEINKRSIDMKYFSEIPHPINWTEVIHVNNIYRLSIDINCGKELLSPHCMNSWKFPYQSNVTTVRISVRPYYQLCKVGIYTILCWCYYNGTSIFDLVEGQVRFLKEGGALFYEFAYFYQYISTFRVTWTEITRCTCI